MNNLRCCDKMSTRINEGTQPTVFPLSVLLYVPLSVSVSCSLYLFRLLCIVSACSCFHRVCGDCGVRLSLSVRRSLLFSPAVFQHLWRYVLLCFFDCVCFSVSASLCMLLCSSDCLFVSVSYSHCWDVFTCLGFIDSVSLYLTNCHSFSFWCLCGLCVSSHSSLCMSVYLSVCDSACRSAVFAFSLQLIRQCRRSLNELHCSPGSVSIAGARWRWRPLVAPPSGGCVSNLTLGLLLLAILGSTPDRAAANQVHNRRVLRSDQGGIQFSSGTVPQVSVIFRTTCSKVSGEAEWNVRTEARNSAFT